MISAFTGEADAEGELLGSRDAGGAFGDRLSAEGCVDSDVGVKSAFFACPGGILDDLPAVWGSACFACPGGVSGGLPGGSVGFPGIPPLPADTLATELTSITIRITIIVSLFQEIVGFFISVFSPLVLISFPSFDTRSLL
jgi:hypothetical protein